MVGSPFQVTTCVRWKEFSLAMEIKSLVSLYEGVFQEISTNQEGSLVKSIDFQLFRPFSQISSQDFIQSKNDSISLGFLIH